MESLDRDVQLAHLILSQFEQSALTMVRKSAESSRSTGDPTTARNDALRSIQKPVILLSSLAKKSMVLSRKRQYRFRPATRKVSSEAVSTATSNSSVPAVSVQLESARLESVFGSEVGHRYQNDVCKKIGSTPCFVCGRLLNNAGQMAVHWHLSGSLCHVSCLSPAWSP